MQKSLEKKVFEYCEKHQMLEAEDGVVLGVSGGADSVCLLLVLAGMRQRWNLKLHVVHVNHGIRKEAGEDADYVRQLCEQYDLPFYLYQADIPAVAKERGLSLEEAGRQVRYEAFEEVMKQQNCRKIAVAHNCNDRAETMLFHLFRGTGLTGLSGIRPRREQIIRPILCLERAEIEAYLNEKNVLYCHDLTNDSDDYTRNKIRHHVLPYAEQEIVKGSVANMVRTADILEETENYIEEQVQQAQLNCVRTIDANESSFLINRQFFLQEHNLIQKRLLLRLLKELSPRHKDISAVHVEDALTLFHRQQNRTIHLPYRICARRQYEDVILERVVEEASANPGEPVSIDLVEVMSKGMSIYLDNGDRIDLKCISCEKNQLKCDDIPQNQYTKWFDCDKIKGCLTLRIRTIGDYLCIKGKEAMVHKKLKDYMISEKIPARCRAEIPLLTEGNHVLWVVGYRISEYYKVDTSTKRILQVSYYESKDTQMLTNGEEKIWPSM